MDAGYEWSAVRWQTHGAGTACFLVYNYAVDSIQRSVEYIAHIAERWEQKHSRN
jgi:hypothetical protein